MGGMVRSIFSFLIRAAVTAAAFLWIFQKVDFHSLRQAFNNIRLGWIVAGITFYFVAQFLCVARWRLLVPAHPALTWKMLANSYFVGTFFSAFLPTTVGGDVVRGYDLIKATGEWRGGLASILMDRLMGFLGLTTLALAAWIAFPPARQDPVLGKSLLGLCVMVTMTFCVLGSRRVLSASLKPFGKIGLGALQSHARQFQETLLDYRRQPKLLAKTFFLSVAVQLLSVLCFLSASRALHLHVPFLFLLLTTPIVFLVSQLPISLGGLGVREQAMILFFQRIGIGATFALSVSLLYAGMPLLAGAIGGVLFFLRAKKRPPRPS